MEQVEQEARVAFLRMAGHRLVVEGLGVKSMRNRRRYWK